MIVPAKNTQKTILSSSFIAVNCAIHEIKQVIINKGQFLNYETDTEGKGPGGLAIVLRFRISVRANKHYYGEGGGLKISKKFT